MATAVALVLDLAAPHMKLPSHSNETLPVVPLGFRELKMSAVRWSSPSSFHIRHHTPRERGPAAVSSTTSVSTTVSQPDCSPRKSLSLSEARSPCF